MKKYHLAGRQENPVQRNDTDHWSGLVVQLACGAVTRRRFALQHSHTSISLHSLQVKRKIRTIRYPLALLGTLNYPQIQQQRGRCRSRGALQLPWPWQCATRQRFSEARATLSASRRVLLLAHVPSRLRRWGPGGSGKAICRDIRLRTAFGWFKAQVPSCRKFPARINSNISSALHRPSGLQHNARAWTRASVPCSKLNFFLLPEASVPFVFVEWRFCTLNSSPCSSPNHPLPLCFKLRFLWAASSMFSELILVTAP